MEMCPQMDGSSAIKEDDNGILLNPLSTKVTLLFKAPVRTAHQTVAISFIKTHH
jgi:hypothetical protein